MKTKSFFLVRRLILIVLVLLLALSSIQAVGTLWGRQIVTREIYSSAQNNVTYLRDTFEENLKQIHSGVYEQLFIREGAQLVNFYTKVRLGSFHTPAEYQWDLQERFSELAVVRGINPLVNELDVYFPRLEMCMQSKPTTGSSNVKAITQQDVDRLTQTMESQSQLLMEMDGEYYVGVSYPNTAYQRNAAQILVTAHLSESDIQSLLSDFNTYSGKNALLYHHTSESCINSRGSISLSGEDLDALFSGASQETFWQRMVTLAGEDYVAMGCYSTSLNCSFVQLIPARQINAVPDMLLRIMVLFLAAALLVMVVLLLTLNRYVNRPVRTLTAAFNTVGCGELNIQVAPQSSREFNVLAEGFNRMISHLRELIDTNYRQTIMLQRSQLKTLQAQINPHFLYNSFFFLRSMLENEETEIAAEFSGYLGKYFRYITKAEGDLLPLEEEYDHAVTYLNIQLMRYGETVRAEIPELPETMRVRMVPKLFLQPILENCIEHGLGVSSGNAVIYISFAENKIIVENSGDGFSEQRLKLLWQQLETTDDDSRTSGLANVHRRLKLHYGELGGVELAQSSLGGLKVILKIGGTDHDISDSAC